MNLKTIVGAMVAVVLLAMGVSLFYMQSPKAMAKEEAINAVIAAHPDLAAYKTTSLPPSTIKATQTGDTWFVGFIQSGSGLPGIVHAECYRVAANNEVVAVGQYPMQGATRSEKVVESITLETCEPVFAQTAEPAGGTPTQSAVLPYGKVTLKLNQTAIFKNISVKPLSIVEDSRCPSDVQCIQAGTVRVKIQVVSGMGTSTSIVKLGSVFTTEAESITLTDVTPGKVSTRAVTDADYRLTFNVVPQGTPVANNPNGNTQGKCYIGGCSSQLCSDQPDMMSTCEYTAKYACYKTAKCERQQTGQCGWTPTAELNMCLANAQ
jgi:hypothetical protein